MKTDKDMWVKYTFFGRVRKVALKSGRTTLHFRCLNVLICFDVDLQTSHSNSVTVHTTQLLRQLQPSDIESCPGLTIYYHKDAKTCQKHQMEKDFCRFAVCASMRCPFLGSNFRQSADVPRCLGSGTGDQAKSPSTHRRGGFEIFK